MDSLTSFERDLLIALSDRLDQAPPPESPSSLTAIDASLLTSAWQKAIRRGDAHLATRCAWELHGRDPDYLWRRIRIIALEDISVGDIELVATILAVAGKRALQLALGPQRLLAVLMDELARAQKSRTACDLAVLLPPNHVDSSGWMGRPDLTVFDRKAVFQLANRWRNTTSHSAYEEGVWRTVSRSDRRLRDRYLEEMQAPSAVRFIATRGSGTEALNVLLAMAWQLKELGRETVALDRSPSPAWNRIGELPAYAFCMYSAPGRQALGEFLRLTPWRQKLKALGVRNEVKALGHLVFYVEGGHLTHPLHVRHAMKIQDWSQEVSLGRFGFPAELIVELKADMIRDLPRLNAFRRLAKTTHET